MQSAFQLLLLVGSVLIKFARLNGFVDARLQLVVLLLYLCTDVFHIEWINLLFVNAPNIKKKTICYNPKESLFVH